jgi:CRISPR/Cas system Type II protein with McrA/HNH and RuvC-like nuclease domain
MQNPAVSTGDYVLGIDLGTSSVGWAMIAWRDGGPVDLLRAGSRVFDAGMDVDNKSGKESSRNLARRTARLIRRQHWRRGRRLKKIFNLLKSYGLLPEGRVSSPEERQDYLNRLDNTILDSQWFRDKSRDGATADPRQVMPYMIRAAALDVRLEPYFLGRAFYHLAQRRGFLSNRVEITAASNVKKEEGKVKAPSQNFRRTWRHLGREPSVNILRARIRTASESASDGLHEQCMSMSSTPSGNRKRDSIRSYSLPSVRKFSEWPCFSKDHSVCKNI